MENLNPSPYSDLSGPPPQSTLKLFPDEKSCTGCERPLSVENFRVDKSRKDGRQFRCKDCQKRDNAKPQRILQRKFYRDQNPPTAEQKEIIRLRSSLYYEANKDQINQKKKEEYAEDSARFLEKSKLYSSTPRAQQKRKERSLRPEAKSSKRKSAQKYLSDPFNYANNLASQALYRSTPEAKAKRREWDRERKKIDPQHRLRGNLRGRLNRALKANSKSGSGVRDLGCSISDFELYLESKFLPGMTWCNWGKGFGNWNIDHIVPLVDFDLTDRQHFVLACHYLNLQPLWFEDNLAKRKVPARTHSVISACF